MSISRTIMGAWIVIAAALSACASVNDDRLQAFAKSTAALNTVASEAAELNLEIDRRLKVGEEASTYASGGPVSLNVAPGEFLSGSSDADWEVIKGFLNALSAYADALAKAADPKLQTDTAQQYASLGEALSNLAQAHQLASGVSAENAEAQQRRVATISGIAAEMAAVVTRLHTRVQIRAVMERVHPILEDAEEPLTEALGLVWIQTRRKLDLYHSQLRDRLVDARESLPSYNARHELYRSIISEHDQLARRVDALSKTAEAVSKMIKAHKELKDNPDSSDALLEFLGTVKSIAEQWQKGGLD